MSRFALSLLLLLIIAGCQKEETPVVIPPDVKLQPASPEELTAVVSKYKGKVVLVDYWANYCVPCIRDFPHNKEWRDKYGSDKLVVITMFMDEEGEAEAALAFLKEQNATFPNFRSSLGGEEEAMQAYGVPGESLPYYRIYGPDGEKLAEFGAGNSEPWDSSDVELALRNALGLKSE